MSKLSELAELLKSAKKPQVEGQVQEEILPGIAPISAATWQDVPGYSWCDYTKDFTLASNWDTTDEYQVIHDDFAVGGIANKPGNLSVLAVDNRSSAIYQNYEANDSMILAIIAYRLTADANVRA